MRNFHQHGIDTRGRISGRIKTICPQCNDTRGHKGNKSLSVDLDKGLCYCHHCGYKFYVPDDAEERLKQQRRDMRRKPAAPPQHFRRPAFDPARMQLSENLERYWTTVRCLPQELLRALRITEETVRLPETGQEENCICFNYFENGTLVNTKYRSARKHFMMVKGAELIPYNVDSILDTPECIITEGEFDAAAVIAAGRKDVVSVPAGAQSNLTWLDRFVESHFEDKQAIYIAVDEDPAGQSLRQELTRRLGVERCRIVHFGEGCKDANEHLVKFGVESLRICIEQAEEVPSKASSPPKTAATTCAPSTRTACNAVPTPVGTTSTSTAPSNLAACWSSPDAPATASPNSPTNWCCASACGTSGKSPSSAPKTCPSPTTCTSWRRS